MESIFSKNASARTGTVYDQIGPEIKHLQKSNSVRSGVSHSKRGAWAASIALGLLLVLFFMDPFLYAMHKTTAIHAYVYLHRYDSGPTTDALIASKMFSNDEILAMNARQGSFQNYYSSPAQAEREAASAVSFMNGLHDLRYGQYQNLDALSKLRYFLFVRLGIDPPTVWSGLNPSVD